MTVQASTVVDEQPVYVFKGSGFELDVPFGSKLNLDASGRLLAGS
jgi:hypothetical protein